MSPSLHHFLFFFNATATTEIYTLSLHDALPISFTGGTFPGTWKNLGPAPIGSDSGQDYGAVVGRVTSVVDRKSTRLNSSHVEISYAVFCLKKKKEKISKYGLPKIMIRVAVALCI